jgi:uncharacterized protein (TIGR00661 family)
MARIIYAVAGEGYGHSSRAHLVGQRLIDAGHELIFVSSQRALLYLSQYFGEQVKEVFGLGFDYHKGYVSPTATIKKNFIGLCRSHKINRRLYDQYYRPFKPDLVITDFEPFTGWWAWRNRVPFISLGHENFIIKCRLEHDLRNIFSRFNATVVTRCMYAGAKVYIIINFYKTPLRGRSTILAPPIIRPVVSTLKPGVGNFIVVYTTTGIHKEKMLNILNSFKDNRFYVYGFNQSYEQGNCILKERSTEGFLRDLADSRGIIATAGFSLISECLYLKKKMLLLPIAGQYEQIINAYYMEKLGLGVRTRRLDAQSLDRYLTELEKPMPENDRIIWPDNEKFFEIFAEVMKQFNISI